MDSNELCRLLVAKLSEVLASGGDEGPDPLLAAEYRALLLMAVETVGADGLHGLCLDVLNALYQAKRNRSLYWVDLIESWSVMTLRQQMLERAAKADHTREGRLADYRLDEILRIGRHVTPDVPATLRYASAVRAAYPPTNASMYGANCMAAHLDLIYRTRRTGNDAWLDALWEVSVSSMREADDASWTGAVENATAGKLPKRPATEPVAPGRTEVSFEGLDVTVITSGSVTLTNRQRETLRSVARSLGGSRAVALIGDRTCIAMDLAQARYGFGFLVESARREASTFVYRSPEQHTSYLGDGRYLVSAFGTLLQLVEQGEYPTPPEWMEEGVGIPLPTSLAHRDEALMACAKPVVLAVSIPNVPMPEHDTRDISDVCIRASQRDGYDAPTRCWGYDVEHSWTDENGHLPSDCVIGLRHWGEGTKRNRYGSDSFIAHVGEGYAHGTATDAANLLSVLREEAYAVTDTNEGIRRWESDDGRVHFDWPCGEAERVKSLFADFLSRMVREEKSTLEDIALWEGFLKEDEADESPEDGIAYDLEQLGALQEKLDGIRDRISRWNDTGALLRQLQDLRMGTVIEKDSPLLEVGAPRDAATWSPDGPAPYFEYDSGPRAIREVLDNSGIDVERTLANVRRLCSTPEGAYLNPDADAMRELLEGLLAAEEHELSEAQRRDLLWETEWLYDESSHLQASILAQEAKRRGYIPSREVDVQSLWISVDREVVGLLSHSPRTLDDAIRYLECLEAIDREFDLSGGPGHHQEKAPDGADTMRWHIWRYLHHDGPACEALSSTSAEYAPPTERQRLSSAHLHEGAAAIVAEGPLRGRRATVVKPCDTQGNVMVEMRFMGRTSTLKMEGRSLLALDWSPPAKIDLSIPMASMDDRQRIAMRECLDALVAFAQHAPAREDVRSAVEYLRSARTIAQSVRRFIGELNVGNLDGYEMESQVGSLRRSIMEGIIGSGLYDELGEYCIDSNTDGEPSPELLESIIGASSSFSLDEFDGDIDD